MPPANLILKVLKHIQECKAATTLVVPIWEAQPWWPLLQKLAKEELVFNASPMEIMSGQVEYWKQQSWKFKAVRIVFNQDGETM